MIGRNRKKNVLHDEVKKYTDQDGGDGVDPVQPRPRAAALEHAAAGDAKDKGRPRVVAERQQHRSVLAPQKPLPHKAFHGFRPHGIAPRQPQQQSGYPCAAHAEQAPEQRPQSPPRRLRRPQRHQQLRDDEKRKQRRYHRCSAKLYAVPNPLCRNGFAAQQQNGQPAGRAAGQPKDPSLQSHHRRYFMRQPPPDMRGDRQLFRLRRIGFFTRGVRPSGSGYRRWSRWQNCQKSCRG